jgi:hypothetical protein
LDGSGLNCVVMEAARLTPAFVAAARKRGLAVVAEGGPAKLAVDGYLVEGEQTFEGKPVVRLGVRTRLPRAAITGTAQGLWPGIKIEKAGKTEARPSGGPWIETNSGFLRFARATLPPETQFWMANRPPAEPASTATRYIQAVADAAMSGARWVVSIDAGYTAALEKGEPRAVAGWQRIKTVTSFYERERAYCDWPEWSRLLVVEDAASGALVSGSVLDMLAPKHIPARVATPRQIAATPPAGVSVLLNIDPGSLSPAELDAVRDVARRGATVLSGPPGWRVALPPENEFRFDQAQSAKLDEMWREINSVVGRRNFGARVFGGPGMLSNLKRSPDGSRLALHLVNFTDYPVQAITVQFDATLKRATLLTPQGVQSPELYGIEDGTGVDIDKVTDVAILVVDLDQPKR